MYYRSRPILITSAILGVMLVIGLFAAGLMPFVQTGKVAAPTGSTVQFPTRTARPDLSPDVRIAQFESLGIYLVNQKCSAPCDSPIRPNLTLGEFIQKVGAPEKVSSLHVGSEYKVDLVYANRGFIVFAYRPFNDDPTTMTPDMLVTSVRLYNARSLDALEQEVMIVSGVKVPFEKYQDWTGFGPVRSVGP